jgi:tRNA pseudouridine32 synthase/23S rRNA pseudouridine746 synthase
MITFFDPQPERTELPARLPSPFDPPPPHPIARRAAELLLADLRRGQPLPPAAFEGNNRGKMFAVLVVAAPDGRVGFLRGFSGMIAGSWCLDGFVGPLFDLDARDRFWPAGQAELDVFDAQLAALACGPQVTSLRAALAEVDDRQAALLAALEERAAASRQRRHAERQRLAARPPADLAGALHLLAQESRADKAVLRQQRAAGARERRALVEALAGCERQRVALRAQRTARSCELLEQLLTGYQIASARGEVRPVRALFAPETPPGGAGDCAAPKLFGHAQRAGLRPIALAELWWGEPPLTGGRRSGCYYPSCRKKCGPVLAHMLEGLAVEPLPVFGGDPIPSDQPRTVHEDRWLLVVDKPVALLSVPGRGRHLADSVLTRLRARYPEASGPLLVHRLDLDTSGLMLAAKDQATYVALQRQFARREVCKEYVAWLEGPVTGETGVVDLPLRVDLDDRPRQIHDPVHGKAALTEWRVLARSATRTRVAFSPRTGRTHQLRVHAATGLGAPIVGDRLYGTADRRLMLHAEALRFVHPHSGVWVEVRVPAPF